MEGTLDYYVYDFIRDTEEYKDLRSRVATDIERMRANAIAFLKEEGAWPETAED